MSAHSFKQVAIGGEPIRKAGRLGCRQFRFPESWVLRMAAQFVDAGVQVDAPRPVRGQRIVALDGCGATPATR